MKAIVLVADGFEEIEAVSPADILVRSGVTVEYVAVSANLIVNASHGCNIICDRRIESITEKEIPDVVILPGGMPGAANLAQSAAVRELVKRTYNEGRTVAAICAAPAVALSRCINLDGRKCTCYPGMSDQAATKEILWQPDARVVVDGNIITSKGPGTAADFGFAIAEHLLGAGSTAALKKGMQFE